MTTAIRRFRMFVFITAAAVLIHCGLPAPAAAGRPEAEATQAEAAAVIDVASGRIVYQKQGDKRLRIASLTKVMTAIVAIEHGNLSDVVKVSGNAHGKEGSSLYLRLGEEMSLHTMLYGLMLRSGNDAATAIAEHVGGSEEGFVYLMNEKARLIGMRNTGFRNPHGLDEDGHYSSATDMALLAAYALRNRVFREIVGTPVKKAPNPNESWDYTWVNKNKMLLMYEGADGVKTGYTKLANRTLISSATRGGQQFAVVTLNDRDDWNDHRKLLDYAFRHYPLTTIVRQGERIQPPNLVSAKRFEYPLAEREAAQLRKRIVLYPESSTDYRLGLRGRLELFLASERIGSLPLYEDGSDRLKAEEKAAFRFTRYDKDRDAAWRDIWLQLTERLFTGRAKEG